MCTYLQGIKLIGALLMLREKIEVVSSDVHVSTLVILRQELGTREFKK